MVSCVQHAECCEQRKEAFVLNAKIINSAPIGERLRCLRGSKTAEEVAKDLDLSVSAIGMYERGCRIPRDDIKVKLARYYGKTVQELFFDQ